MKRWSPHEDASPSGRGCLAHPAVGPNARIPRGPWVPVWRRCPRPWTGPAAATLAEGLLITLDATDPADIGRDPQGSGMPRDCPRAAAVAIGIGVVLLTRG